MLSEKTVKKLYVPCAICVHNLGYVDDAPKFASDRGLRRHLKNEHNVEVNKRERFAL
jgi:hypothetical protein